MSAPITPAPASTAAAPPDASTGRKYLLERIGEAAVVQLYADGFSDLPLREKTLVWHLAQAAIAGRDIFYDQRYAHNLDMRDVLEAIVTHRDGDRSRHASRRSSATRNCSGSTPDRTTTSPRANSCCGARRTRSPPRRTPRRARARRFPQRDGETLDALLARLQPMFFDPEFDPTVTSKTPPGGKDILTASANNLYERRDDGRPRRFRGEASAQLAPGQARRPAGRRGLPRRRTLRRADRRDRRPPRGGAAVRDRADGARAARA